MLEISRCFNKFSDRRVERVDGLFFRERQNRGLAANLNGEPPGRSLVILSVYKSYFFG